MKARERVLQVESTLGGEIIPMVIDAGSMAQVIGVLTDLYGDPLMAVIREYSTNALDAHLEAGVTRPIEVTTPSTLSQFIKIRDYGTGLSADDIREIYSRYGVSTKRSSDDFVGMLGLGCKSGLTYAPQFTLTGVKDGVCTQVNVSRMESGAPTMTILQEYETDDPSGVEVVIPAKHGDDVAGKCAHLFRFWEPGTVLVDGAAPRRIDGLWLTDDLLLTREVKRPYVVMGGVPYPNGAEDHYGDKQHVVAFVEVGAVDFAPSREQLADTRITRATLETIRLRVQEEKVLRFNEDLAACATGAEAIAKMLNFRDYQIKMKGEWSGEEIPTSLSLPAPPDKTVNGMVIKGRPPHMLVVAREKPWKGKRWGFTSHIPINQMPGTVFFHGFPHDDFTSHKVRKLDQWIISGGPERSATQYVFLSSIPKTMRKWIAADRIHHWQSVEDTRLPKVARDRSADPGRYDGLPRGSYSVWTKDGGMKPGTVAKDIDRTKPIYYIRAKDWWSQALITEFAPDAYVVELPQNRMGRFVKDFPMAVKLDRTVYSTWIETWKKGLDQDSLDSIAVHWHLDREKLHQLDPIMVDDPELKRAVELSINHTDVMKIAKAASSANLLSSRDFDDVDDPLERYPLFPSWYREVKTNLDHIYLYVNAVYAASQEGEGE